MMELLQFSLCFLGFNCFALAKFNHFRDVFKKKLTEKQRHSFLMSGWITILLSLLLSVLNDGGYGALLFCGYMALSVVMLMILYSFTVSWVKYVSVLTMSVLLLSGFSVMIL
ncbi:DUF3325 domain-containing protein [Pseudoalteromonas sp. SSMSWG5]|jgi:hypothetical protein|uniref:DUF3325 domain-containing protein n=1 Tax=Pseudoalteromonas TaxID=53246 RepID=UPI000C39622A|nr:MULTISPECIES: DUF3325 domain-containing protein [unclassified Pseudoalteromonas]MBD56604.1 hypothetical protein [Pseudoalteromonas sp.]MCF2921960.1 DUF3325 domain-containing protein [Pseudoalteromonas sp. APAL1]MCO7250132.1 DUF3325 domain-containing protein [Pseudoalteromonas sp. Ps84H-4]TGV17299.1 DUF3325 domain-containing protein [Pseudoalteromonas sp. MEBiC 03607]TMO47575.1 DUF3325 domain-containing protein [Pseudoalteromonas sp. S4389]|tara:strand:+ start:324 stop:659 length:336 start_codon:yes stop_codon:yes gene_type:complete